MIPEKMKARQRISKSPLQKGNIYAVTSGLVNNRGGVLFDHNYAVFGQLAYKKIAQF
jgi:hypothetical protein